MSISRSVSINSSTSTATMTTISPTDLVANSSNGLYENREHFQAIFTNDSRFFDTSLHLFKSYYSLGYIPSDDEKHKKLHVPIITTTTASRQKHRWKPRLLGLHHNNNNSNHEGTLKAFLTPILLRKNDQINRARSESGNSTHELNNRQEKSSMIVHYQQALVPNINISDDMRSDESEVTITRL
ncbi:unnamed protein product [Adineta steineri]|uniref:Uncharacterized protein n=1 Tax=Adineta steineri TaxID=433720 RepID=A0A814I3W7_9BILA|nr:unnamed protein product [Adineta steineri]CAF3610950.1 unnamed protein product [Adineta steineri]